MLRRRLDLLLAVRVQVALRILDLAEVILDRLEVLLDAVGRRSGKRQLAERVHLLLDVRAGIADLVLSLLRARLVVAARANGESDSGEQQDRDDGPDQG